MNSLPEKFRNYIDELGLVRSDQRVLLAVSGGIDSMVMLSLFVRGGGRVGVAHCNFGLRGAESDGDEALVAAVAAFQ